MTELSVQMAENEDDSPRNDSNANLRKPFKTELSMQMAENENDLPRNDSNANLRKPLLSTNVEPVRT